jgi:hypothetical protein
VIINNSSACPVTMVTLLGFRGSRPSPAGKRGTRMRCSPPLRQFVEPRIGRQSHSHFEMWNVGMRDCGVETSAVSAGL